MNSDIYSDLKHDTGYIYIFSIQAKPPEPQASAEPKHNSSRTGGHKSCPPVWRSCGVHPQPPASPPLV